MKNPLFWMNATCALLSAVVAALAALGGDLVRLTIDAFLAGVNAMLAVHWWRQ